MVNVHVTLVGLIVATVQHVLPVLRASFWILTEIVQASFPCTPFTLPQILTYFKSVSSVAPSALAAPENALNANPVSLKTLTTTPNVFPSPVFQVTRSKNARTEVSITMGTAPYVRQHARLAVALRRMTV